MAKGRAGERRKRRAQAPARTADVGAGRGATGAFSDATAGEIKDLKAFLMQHVYRHKHIMRIMGDAETIVRNLFKRYMADPPAMPEAWHAASHGLGEPQRARLIADFVAGMTDRYAIAEHRRLFDATPNLR